MSPGADADKNENSPLFWLEDLDYTYPDGTRALEGVTLQINQGDRIALVGSNGSGKSTLVRHLNGLLAVQKGVLTFKGKPLRQDHLRALRFSVGMLFQDPDDQLFCSTLYEDVAFGPMNKGIPRKQVDDLVREHLTAVGLDHLRHKPAHHLSYGQKKRAAFAAVLAMAPEVLILDEPSANLDPCQEKVFLDLLRKYQGTLIVIDHDLLFLWDICTRAIVLDHGSIHHNYLIKDLVSQPQALRSHGLDFSFRFTCCGNHPNTRHVHHHHHPDTHAHEHARHQKKTVTKKTAPPLLELQHYSFTHPDGTPGIRDINLAIHDHETIALIGENGAGKSTLASCLLGINRGRGYFLYRGRELDFRQRGRLWREVGMVFQHCADQLFCPSCWEEVAFGPQQLGLCDDEVADRVAAALAKVRLNGFEERVPLNMSDGERKRLAIAAAMAMGPNLLILDEPTAGLDPANEELLMDILEEMRIARLLITHDLFFINRLSRRAVVIHEGQIIRDYLTADFLADDHLETVSGLDYTYKNACTDHIFQLQNTRSVG